MVDIVDHENLLAIGRRHHWWYKIIMTGEHGPMRALDLDRPPKLVQCGAALHGVRARREEYLLPQHWCVHLYSYKATLEVDGVAMPIAPGCASLTPPGARMVYRYRGPSRHLYAHFACASHRASHGSVMIAAMQDLGERFAALQQQMRQMVSWFATQPRRGDARLWDILWQLVQTRSEAPATTAQGTHPAFERAVQEIEMQLDRPLELRDLARQVGVSHNHLIRLFRRHSGQTIAGYLRQRRVQRAQHLLLHSTLPIKAIACSVGLSDLQRFNKTMRRETGRSPRQWRTT